MATTSQPVQGPGVSEWYAGRTILVTGGTGYMGKVLLEKLLYSCPDIQQILILVRPKAGLVPQHRIEKMLALPLFDRLHAENPEVLLKLRAVEGDMTLPDLGLSELDRKMIHQTVSVIFHCAASLHMETSLKVAVISNVLSTHRLLDLAENITKLEVFLHISTAFCHCDLEVMEEQLYPAPVCPHKIIELVQTMDESVIEEMTPSLMAGHPNVYTYTKCLSEALVEERASKVNAVVVRPSVVMPSYCEPIPGWVDSLNGLVGIIVAVGKGVLRSMMAAEDSNIQGIPVDIAIKGFITIAYTVANNKTGAVQVYNVTQGDVKPMTWREMTTLGFHHILESPYENVLWYPGVINHNSRLTHNICTFLLQLVPAYCIDQLLALTGNKKFMMRIQQRLSAGIRVLEYFSTRKWNFRNEKFWALETTLPPQDQIKFHMRVENEVNLDEYMGNVVLGSRQYLMKEPLTSLPQSRAHIKRLYYIHMIFVCACYALLLWAGFHFFTWLFGASVGV